MDVTFCKCNCQSFPLYLRYAKLTSNSTGHMQISNDPMPIIELLKKGNKYVWCDACDEAFKNLKMLLTTSPVLAQPDITKPFDVYCDTSCTSLGGVSMQEGDPKVTCFHEDAEGTL
jgi:hypothetical protein